MDRNKEYDLYKNIKERCGGEIYIGVVGPVRTGKSTFIKRFMEWMVLPYLTDAPAKERATDELPQAAAGKTIMTTEPKFIPQQAAEIKLLGKDGGEDGCAVKVRLIDCVGFLVEGAVGHMEGNEKRMVKTPWFDYEIPFSEAAAIRTEKVIKDHATIGLVVTTDGSIGELPRENYMRAEERTVQELKNIGKPFVVLLNTTKPYGEETRQLAAELSEKYGTLVLPVNCEQLRKDDIIKILESILFEFPLQQISFFIPKWTELLPMEHKVKEEMIKVAMGLLNRVQKMRDVYEVDWQDELTDTNCLSKIKMDEVDLASGKIHICMEVEDSYYYENISELSGIPVKGEYELINLIKEMSARKSAYEKVADAFEMVQAKGYGVVNPGLPDIKMEEPVLIRHGNKFGVKIKAVSPSIHMIRANIETEIAPIIGSEEQANDLIQYIKEGQQSNEGVWETNIFGKSVGELMEDGIRSKIAMMDDECQMKLQDTMQKIVN
ncbi:MAG: stage IV sporulation protein A, partial [Lachnospiraceae bacterium]|nr:stage IV sporulation protein A [Lachnospiraceae bacterium]